MSPSFQLEEQGAWVRFSKGDMKNAKDDVLPASTGVGDPSKANKLAATSVGQQTKMEHFARQQVDSESNAMPSSYPDHPHHHTELVGHPGCIAHAETQSKPSSSQPERPTTFQTDATDGQCKVLSDSEEESKIIRAIEKELDKSKTSKVQPDDESQKADCFVRGQESGHGAATFATDDLWNHPPANPQASQPAAMSPKDQGSLRGGSDGHAGGGEEQGDHGKHVDTKGGEKESMEGLDQQASMTTMPPQVSATLLDDTLAPQDQSPATTMNKDYQNHDQNMHPPNQDEHCPQKLHAFSNAPAEGIEKTNVDPDPHGSHEPAEAGSAESSASSADKEEHDALYTSSHGPEMIPGLFGLDSGDECGPYDPGPELDVTGGDEAGKVAHSLEDSMSFWDYCLDELEDSRQLTDLVSGMEGDTVSTAFSGVDAPKVAMNCLHWRLESRLATQIPKTRTLFSIEWNQEAQKELLLLDMKRNKNDNTDQSDMPCIFGDMSDFWQADLKPVIEQLKQQPTMAVEVLAPRISAGTATTRVAHCLRHSRKCAVKVARRHLSGTSCTAHSKRGAGLSLADPNVVHLLSWISQRLDLQEPSILQENVPTFPCDILKRFLYRLYWMDVLNLDACWFGVPQAR